MSMPPSSTSSAPRHRAARFVAGVLVCTGCGLGAGPTDRVAERSRRAPSVRAAPPAPHTPPAIDAFTSRRELATALVGRWLEAQNRGDFAAYETLYAPSFAGIKRTPSHTTRYDRRGWLEDRRRMFARPMTVSADGIAVVAADDDAIVSFTQRYASGRYADEGTKRMRVSFGDEGPRILSEELLTPKRVSPTEVQLDAGVMLVTRLSDGKPYVVLGYAPPEMRGGPLHLLGAPSTRLDAARDLSPEDAGIAAPLLREPLTVYTADTSCAAQVTALRLVRGAEVMDPVVFEPDVDAETAEEIFEGRRTSSPDPEVVWSIGASGGPYAPERPHPPWLVGELQGGCAHDGVLAVRSGVPPPRVLPVVEPSKRDGMPFIEAFAATEAGADYDADAQGTVGLLRAAYLGRPLGGADEGSSGLYDVELLHIGTGPTQASFLYMHYGHPCGGSATATLLTGRPPTIRVSESMAYGTPVVLGAFDLESDGTPEIVAWIDASTRALVRLGRRPAVLRSYHFSYQVCDC